VVSEPEVHEILIRRRGRPLSGEMDPIVSTDTRVALTLVLMRNSTPVDLAFINLHDPRAASPSEIPVQNTFRSLFDWTEYNEDQEFTELHRIVLGDMDGDLEEALRAFPWKIDDQDGCGCSALWWACSRGDVKATRLLLQHGANLNTPDVEGDYPLHATVYSRSSECTGLLLSHGAPINNRDKFGYTALRALCHLRDDPAHAQIFLDHDSDVNLTDTCGRNPLSAAADINAAATVRLLLANGADLSIQDDHGKTALHVALQNNCHESVKAIVDHQPHYHSGITKGGMSILHMVASVGDLTSIKILAEAELHGPDPDARDAGGDTARDHLQKREDSSKALVELYDELERAVRSAQS
jgi:hypothetical protein